MLIYKIKLPTTNLLKINIMSIIFIKLKFPKKKKTNKQTKLLMNIVHYL